MSKPLSAKAARISAETCRSVSSNTALSSAAEVPKETAAAFTYREMQEIVDRMAVASNRLSAAKKRLQEHFGLPVSDSACMSDPTPGVQPGMDGVRVQLDSLNSRLLSIADGFEELI